MLVLLPLLVLLLLLIAGMFFFRTPPLNWFLPQNTQSLLKTAQEHALETSFIIIPCAISVQSLPLLAATPTAAATAAQVLPAPTTQLAPNTPKVS
jgi:hypothetical protein